MTVFFDTNILLYAALAEPETPEKREKAVALLDAGGCVLSVQVLNEFVVQATHPKREHALSLDMALRYVRAWRRFPVQELTLPLFDATTAIMARGGFSWWDSLIIAAAQAQGCDILYSEDMQDGRIIGGMRIVNPFA